MTSAFISYSRYNLDVADFIADKLRNRNVDVFIDYQRLRSGNFVEQLGAEIEQRDYFLVVISPHAVDSKWVKAEVAWAFSEKTNECIIPIWYKPAKLTNVFVLSALERVDFTRWDDDRKMDDAIGKLCRLMDVQEESLELQMVDQPMLDGTARSDEKLDIDDSFEEESSPQFRKEDVARLFQSAASVQDTDPEQALFLYQQVLEIDPEFMGSQIAEFVARQEELVMPTRLWLLEKEAESAKEKGNWADLLQLAHTMTDINPTDSFALEQIQVAELNLKCEPIYEQARIAHEDGQIDAVKVLMRDIKQNCPEYGDPGGLLVDQPITDDLVGYIRNTQTLLGHTGPIKRVIFSPSGSMLATTSADDTLKIWSVSSGTMIKEFRHPARALSFSPR